MVCENIAEIESGLWYLKGWGPLMFRMVHAVSVSHPSSNSSVTPQHHLHSHKQPLLLIIWQNIMQFIFWYWELKTHLTVKPKPKSRLVIMLLIASDSSKVPWRLRGRVENDPFRNVILYISDQIAQIKPGRWAVYDGESQMFWGGEGSGRVTRYLWKWIKREEQWINTLWGQSLCRLIIPVTKWKLCHHCPRSTQSHM